MKSFNIFSVPLGIVCSAILSAVWLYLLELPDPKIVPDYQTGVIAFGVSTVIELLSEPLYIMAQLLLFVRLKVNKGQNRRYWPDVMFNPLCLELKNMYQWLSGRLYGNFNVLVME